MNELNKIRGYMIPVSQTEKIPSSSSGIKYFILGPENRFYVTSNLALIQFLFSHCESIEKLYESANKHLSKVRFIDKLTLTNIADFAQPETLPFFNSKYFTVSLKTVNNKQIDSSLAELGKDQTFMIFALDDELIISLHAFFTGYHEFWKNEKKRTDFLNFQLELYNQEEPLNSIETLTYKKHLDNYKTKMKLIIKKMEQDEKEIREGIEIPVREVSESFENETVDQNSRLVRLNNKSQYIGGLKNNRPDGQGKEFLPDGSSYVGEFRNGYWHGSGYLVDSENYICYGEFYEGRVIGI